MTQSVLNRLAALRNLGEEWKHFWRDAKHQKSSGYDAITPGSFNRHLDRNLQTLKSDILSGYQFDPLVAHPVPKPDGKKERIICVPTVRDRVAQRTIGAYLANQARRIGILNDVSYGFIKGRGTTRARNRAISLRRDHPWAYKSDISAFFDRIPRDILFEAVSQSVRAPSLDEFLRRAIECEIDSRDPFIRRKVEKAGIQPGLGVRQGMPLSPFFANVVLKKFDRMFISKRIPIVRYADDFVVFADSEQECLDIDHLARNALGDIGLELPELSVSGGKTQICSPDTGVEFLGLSLELTSNNKYGLYLTPKQLVNITSNIALLADFEHLESRGITIVGLARALENKIAGYKSAYPSSSVSNRPDLDELLNKMRVRVLTSTFKNIFGPDSLNKLTKKHKRFLCLENIV